MNELRSTSIGLIKIYFKEKKKERENKQISSLYLKLYANKWPNSVLHISPIQWCKLPKEKLKFFLFNL